MRVSDGDLSNEVRETPTELASETHRPLLYNNMSAQKQGERFALPVKIQYKFNRKLSLALEKVKNVTHIVVSAEIARI